MIAALALFIGKRGHSMKVLTWDGTGTIVVHKKLDAGRFELPRPTAPGEQHLLISDAIVHAMWQDALAHAQAISTDATGALIQPAKTKDGRPQACKKGHFFTAVVGSGIRLGPVFHWPASTH